MLGVKPSDIIIANDSFFLEALVEEEGTEPGRTSRSRKGLGSCEPETRQGPDTGSAPVATLTGAPGRLATAARLQSQVAPVILKVISLMLKVIIVLVTQLCSMSRI